MLKMMPSKLPNTEPCGMDKGNVVVGKVLNELNRLRADVGDSDVKTAEAWISLGLIRLHMQQDPSEAKSCFEEALRILKKNKNQALIAVTLNDLGICLERLQERSEACEAYKTAYEILKAENFSESHPRVLSTQRSLSRLLGE